MKRQIVLGQVPNKEIHQYLIAAVAPRPIAFVSTLDENGNMNLAPYSFFNVFSSNPPIAVFSSNRKGTDNTTKDTLHNVKVNGECVINVVPYAILRQMSLASVEFPRGVSEFEKTGLTPETSLMVKAPRVAESPVNLECRVKDIISLGDKGGAGHLIICEILLISVDEDVMTDGSLDQQKLDLMGRLGKNYYVRASGDALMEISQVVAQIPLGFDGLPKSITESNILTGNEIAALASLTTFPEIGETTLTEEELKNLSESEKHQLASSMIKEGRIKEALYILIR
ncbi:MAG: flavin reductase family protein [Saprospiraceae bacterium]|jgi:flavin reductase (DIM6/NTAB) family NADH-FMN oxidoreductase RutF|nr:flavin reductase family protein [Saprospiraceae bacterium]MBP6446932.1 flavin reductase family protein [Saprospiraceae bacterium]